MWASWAVLAERTGSLNNGGVGLLRGPSPPGCCMDNAPVPAAAHRGNDRIVVPRLHAPFDAAPFRDGGNRARLQRILLRQGWGGCRLRGLGGAVRLCLPPGNRGAAGWVGAVAVRRWGRVAGGVPWGRGRGTTVREATMMAAQTDSGGSGGGANNHGGNGAALSAAPLLARAMTIWRRGGQRCLGIVGRPTLIGVIMLSWRQGGLQCLAIVRIPSLTGATTSRRRGVRQCLGIVGRYLPRSCDGGGGGRTTVACFCTGGGGGWTKVPCHCCAMVVVARQMIVPLDSWPYLACSRMVRMEVAWTDSGGSGGDASNGGGNGSSLSTFPLLASAARSWRRGGQQCLGGHTRSAEGRGRNIGRRFKVGWATDVCTGRALMGFFSQRVFYPLLI